MFKKYLNKIVDITTELQSKSTLSSADIYRIGREVEKLHQLRQAADVYLDCLTRHRYNRNVFVTLQHLILNECAVPQAVNDRGECFWFPAGIANAATITLKFDNRGVPNFIFNQINVTSEVAVTALRSYTGKMVNPADLNTILIEAWRLHTGDSNEQT